MILNLIVIDSHKVCNYFLPLLARIVFLLIMALISPPVNYRLAKPSSEDSTIKLLRRAK